jgi:hypothetical protein
VTSRVYPHSESGGTARSARGHSRTLECTLHAKHFFVTSLFFAPKMPTI